ncbi:nuclear transport factor 2 family protein [Flaviaesturariibacter amylovorans]|uniref:Nuclear transport factor 2 family protein n=1 Tax=Flaviaesturariibacter amylovorans TaxID=1084520 RepID=A0ABP8GW86_9BACT
MRFLPLVLTLCCGTAAAQAPSAIPNEASRSAEDSVKIPIQRFFDGMRRSDTAMIRSSLAPNAVLQTIRMTKTGETRVTTDPVDSVLVGIAKPHTDVYDERITYDGIKIDGPMATAWTPYQFYVGEKFSHCGVNSFQLVRYSGEWKIQYIIDTRRRTNCK